LPVYEYRCPNCDLEVALLRRLDDDRTPRCPDCDDQYLNRIFSSVSIVKSEQQRSQDLSWVDKNLAGRLKKKASTKLNPTLQDSLDRMETG
jgi:putative FmdB family regulatory protein